MRTFKTRPVDQTSIMPKDMMIRGKRVPTVSKGASFSTKNTKCFLGFVLFAIVTTADKFVDAVEEMQKVWCPNRDADEWDGEQCQENLYIISKGPDEDYFELEDVSADPKFAEVIDTIRYPLFPYGIPFDKLIPGVVLEPGDIVHENIIHATIGEQMA